MGHKTTKLKFVLQKPAAAASANDSDKKNRCKYLLPAKNINNYGKNFDLHTAAFRTISQSKVLQEVPLAPSRPN